MNKVSKGQNIPLLALILYMVLFFPPLGGNPFISPDFRPEQIPFSILMELGRILTFTLPSLALLWYLISDDADMPKKRDLLTFALGLPGLISIGLGISFLYKNLSDITELIPPPLI